MDVFREVYIFKPLPEMTAYLLAIKLKNVEKYEQILNWKPLKPNPEILSRSILSAIAERVKFIWQCKLSSCEGNLNWKSEPEIHSPLLIPRLKENGKQPWYSPLKLT